jgi:hypothetical protein
VQIERLLLLRLSLLEPIPHLLCLTRYKGRTFFAGLRGLLAGSTKPFYIDIDIFTIHFIFVLLKMCRDLKLLKDVSDVYYFSDFFSVICSREEVISACQITVVCLIPILKYL